MKLANVLIGKGPFGSLERPIGKMGKTYWEIWFDWDENESVKK